MWNIEPMVNASIHESMNRRCHESTNEREEKKEDQGRQRIRRQKMQVRKKLGKSRNTVFCQWFVAPEGRKVGSLKLEKVYAAVAPSTFLKSKSQNVQNMLGPLLEAEMSKKCTPLKRKAHFRSQTCKNWGGRSTFGRSDVALRSKRSTFGDALCLEKHRVPCICYLSKTHFVRAFLQNSIGNSSTSTACNPIYIAGTISLTNSFPNELFLC